MQTHAFKICCGALVSYRKAFSQSKQFGSLRKINHTLLKMIESAPRKAMANMRIHFFTFSGAMIGVFSNETRCHPFRCVNLGCFDLDSVGKAMKHPVQLSGKRSLAKFRQPHSRACQKIEQALEASDDLLVMLRLRGGFAFPFGVILLLDFGFDESQKLFE